MSRPLFPLLLLALPALATPDAGGAPASLAATAASAGTAAATSASVSPTPEGPGVASSPVAPAPVPAPASAAAGGPLPTTTRAGATGGNATPSAAPKGDALLWELDPYYSSVAWERPLTAASLPDGGRLPEREVYGRLLADALHPRLLLLEASIYPLPILGTWFKRHSPEHYDDFKIGTLGNNQLNVIEGITAGFQEPWAISAFLGNGMQFTRDGEAASTRNRGYMGYLLSWGDRHIHNNVLIDDHWWELEWKLKGEREFREEKLDWSFRLGLKSHGNPDIADVAYLGLHRSNLNYESVWLSLLNNSELALLTEVDRHSGRFLRQEAIVGRKLPIRRWHAALSLDIGLIYEDPGKYSGILADPAVDTLTIVFRPHISF